MLDTRQYVTKQIEERDIRFLRLWFTDVMGNLKSFAITPSDVEDAFAGGVGFDASGVEGLASSRESDILLLPDPSTYQVLPWRPSNNGVARMFCDVLTPEGAPAAGDTRRILMETVRRASEAGFDATMGTEIEYFYFKDAAAPSPIDAGGFFDLTPLDNASDLRRDTVLTLEQMGIPVEYSHHESAPSQHEIDLRFSDALAAADAVMTARLVVREVACAQGVHASFMPKPIEGVQGSGMHVHQSLFGDTGNAFFDPDDEGGMGLSAIAKHYMAGLLAYAPEYMLLTNQYVNSYQRLIPGGTVPMYATWGNGNPATFLRIPRYKLTNGLATRIEVRSVDSAANPYLAFAAMLAAGMKGIEDELPLPDPVDADAAPLSPSERAARGIKALPTDLSRATDAFEGSALMREVLGEELHAYLVAVKRAEWEAYRLHVSPWELDRYLAKL